MSSYLSRGELVAALSIPDLTDPADGPHAMQVLLDAIHAALPAPIEVHRAQPIVSIADNYDRLGYPAGGAARDRRYTRYVCESALLRTQTSAMIPPLLARSLPADVVLSCPGLVYRRDVIDRLHVGEPHQVDLWRIARRPLTTDDLLVMIDAVVGAALPGVRWRTQAATHPYTTNGLQIDADVGEWIEIGECGLAAPALVHAPATGLAMGLGLDRLLMLRKGIPDIRLLRARDPRIASQMQDLERYREVSTMPYVRRDLSLAVDEPVDVELLGDHVRAVLGDRAALVEAVDLVSQTPGDSLPPAAIARIGLAPGQLNALVRITLRAVDRSLTDAECNALRDEIYRALHRGTAHQWATPAARHYLRTRPT
jgi:phenylalanyl-tRNA synthetase alpha chain